MILKSHLNILKMGEVIKNLIFLFIPRRPGVISIPERSFSYFDPQQGSYVQKAIPAWQIEVLPGTVLYRKISYL